PIDRRAVLLLVFGGAISAGLASPPAARAQPSPTYPALAVSGDPGFTAVSITGKGFGPPGSRAKLIVQNGKSAAYTIASTAPGSSAHPKNCILFWDSDGRWISFKVPAAAREVRVKVTTAAGLTSSEYIRAQYYEFDRASSVDFHNSAIPQGS